MNIALWVLQVLLGVYFFSVGVNHFIVPPGLPEAMSWMYELPTWLHYFSGTAEILGGLGLILPGLTKIQTRLTPLAAAGLVLVMVGAMVWHVQRGEVVNIFLNLILAALAGFIAYGRWRVRPLRDRNTLATT
ncbi:MAG: DoxX family protein [Anaerolineae bacterium]|nr:DoxX family protein [Anaerolineae bacterium]